MEYGKIYNINLKEYDQLETNKSRLIYYSIKRINPKILSIRLKEMKKLRLIQRKVFSNETPIRISIIVQNTDLRNIINIMAAYSI